MKAYGYFLDLFVTFVFFCRIPKIRTSHDQLQYKSKGTLVLEKEKSGAVFTCEVKVSTSATN